MRSSVRVKKPTSLAKSQCDDSSRSERNSSPMRKKHSVRSRKRSSARKGQHPTRLQPPIGSRDEPSGGFASRSHWWFLPQLSASKLLAKDGSSTTRLLLPELRTGACGLNEPRRISVGGPL